MSEVLDKTKKALRAVLISAPRGVPVRMLCRDFKTVLGYELPYKQLGFHRLEEFIRTIPDVARLGTNNGDPTYYAVADEKTSQILRFVTSQKKPKVKKSGAPPMTQRPMAVSGFTKKSRYGPMSRSKPGGGSGGGGYLGRSFQGGYKSPIGHQYNYSTRSRRPPNNIYQPPRVRQQQQQLFSSSYLQRVSPHYNTGGGGAYSEYVGSSINSRSNSVGSLYSSSNISNNSNSSGLFGGSTAINTSYQGSPISGPRTSGSSTFTSNTSIPRTGGASNLARQATPEHRNQVPPAGWGSPAGARKKEFAGKQWNSKTFRGKAMLLSEISCDVQNNKALPPNLTTVGYIAGEMRLDKTAMVVKYLLYLRYCSKTKKGVFPAIQLTFTPDNWDVESESIDLRNIPTGSKLRVHGVPFISLNKKKQPEAGLKVQFYNYEPPTSETPSISRSSSTMGVGVPSSKSTSPSSSQYPPMSGDFPTLIYRLLKEKSSGIWGKRFGKEFENFHKMEAPKDIMERASALSFVETEIVANEYPILLLKDGCTSPPSEKDECKEEAEVFSEEEEVVENQHMQSVSFTTEKPSLPGVAELKSAEYFDVYVSYINSPTSFYLQHVGEDNAGKLESLVTSMGSYFARNRIKPVKPVEENKLYGYKWAEEDDEEAESWCRVLVSSIYSPHPGSSGRNKGSKMAMIYFPDYGNTMEVGVDKLLELPGEYYQLPFQAVHCCLHGCVGDSHDKATLLFMEAAQDKNCVAQVMYSSGTRVSVELISSESGSVNNSTINSLIMYALHPIHTLAPKLPKPGESRVPVTLSDVDEDGVLMVQVHGPGLSRLQELMTLINTKFQKSKAADFLVKDKIKEGEIYCGLYSVDLKFYRVRIKRVLASQLLVEFVDYGNEDMVDIKKLRKPLQDELFKLPFQAVQCRLYGIPTGKKWSESAHHFVASYLDHEDLYLSVVEEGVGEGQLPLVKITAISGREDEEEEEEVVLNDVIPWEANGDIECDEDELKLSASMKRLSLGDLQHGNRANSGVFVFSGSSASSRRRHHQTTSSAPVTPHTIDSDSGAARTDLKTPNSASGPLFKFEKPLRDGASLPFKFDFSLESLKSNIPIGSKRPAGGGESSSPRINPRVETATSPRESCSFGNRFTPSGSCSSGSHLTPSESGQWGKASPPSGSVTNEGGMAKLSNNVESVACTPSKSPSCWTSNGESDSWQTPNSSAEILGKNYRMGLKELPAAVTEAKKGLVFAILTQEGKKTDPVVVTWVATPHKFVVQQHSGVETLNNLEARLNKALSLSLPLLSEVSPGQLCLAPSSLDDKYYRAMVVGCEGNKVTVEFLDYGNREVTDRSKLKYLPANGRDFPYQAIQCSLRGIGPVANEWSSKELDWFEEYVLEKSFFAMELSRLEGKSTIALLDTSQSDTVDITKSMTEAFPQT